MLRTHCTRAACVPTKASRVRSAAQKKGEPKDCTRFSVDMGVFNLWALGSTLCSFLADAVDGFPTHAFLSENGRSEHGLQRSAVAGARCITFEHQQGHVFRDLHCLRAIDRYALDVAAGHCPFVNDIG